jgi:hypothetical protein
MANKRYFIFRVNGIDNCVLDDANNAKALYDMLILNDYIYINTEVNNLTTTYYFSTETKDK